MRIGCLQFAPQVGDVNNNLNRADAVLSKAAPEDLDLLVLPELAFTGYNFKSLQEIMPFLEPSGSGITSLWARTVALRYDCTVTVGYPEKVDVAPKWPTGPEYYNSAIVVNGDGETIANYRKSFLYYTDESWALEGNGFYNGWIPGAGKTAIGICMDINPYKFEAPWHAYEFAFHILEMQANLVIVSMAWITRDEPREFSRMPNEPDIKTLTYWVARLEPLIRAETEEEIIVVFCNRTGTEDDATYAGTSAVIGVQAGEVNVYGLLGRGQKELLVVDTSHQPFAKLVHRQEGEVAGDVASESHISAAEDVSSDSQPASPDAINTSVPNAESPENRAAETSGQNTDDLASGLRNQETWTSRSPSFPDSRGPTLPGTARDPPASSPSTTVPVSMRPATGTNPTAVRPKLIIPQAYPNPPQQLYPDSAENPASAASATSTRSYQSVKSDQSEASTMTIRSNPRPPEDSTPYPSSGAPLSGYPANYSQPGRFIYGGSMSIQTEGFTPSTAFDDGSPVSFEAYYRQGDLGSPTPISAGGFFPRAVGKQPQPFPWSELDKEPLPAVQNQKDTEKTEKGLLCDRQVVSEWRELKSATPVAALGYNSIQRPHTVACSPSDEKPLNAIPTRPSSPKSRNASRSRLHERSNSAQGRMIADGPAMQTAYSGSSDRTMTSSAVSTITRPASTKPQESQTRRFNSALGAAIPEQRNIPIIACPSVFKSSIGKRPDLSTPSNCDPHGNVLTPPRLRSSPGKSAGSSKGPETPAESGRTPPRTSTRTPSRGRRSDREKELLVSGKMPREKPRSSSTDSTRNDVLHRRVETSVPAESRSMSREGGREARRRSRTQSRGISSSKERHNVREATPDYRGPAVGRTSASRGRYESSTIDKRPVSRQSSRGLALHHSEKQAKTDTGGSSEVSNGLPTLSSSLQQLSLDKHVKNVSVDHFSGKERLERTFKERHRTKSPLPRPSTCGLIFDPPTPKAMHLPDNYWSLERAGNKDIEHLDLSSDTCGVEAPTAVVLA